MTAPLLFLGVDLDSDGRLAAIAGALYDAELRPMEEAVRFEGEQAEGQLHAWLKERVAEGVALVAGPDVPRIRRLLAVQWPTLAAYLHYRSIDLQTVRELVDAWYGGEPAARAKSGADVEQLRAAVEELSAYRASLFTAPETEPAPPSA